MPVLLYRLYPPRHPPLRHGRAELCTLPHHSPYSGRGCKGIPASHRPQLYPAQVGVRSGPEPLRLQNGGRHPGGGTARRQHRPAERYGPHLLALRTRRPACALPDVYRRRRDHRSQQARTLAYRRTITHKNTRKHLRVFFGITDMRPSRTRAFSSRGLPAALRLLRHSRGRGSSGPLHFPAGPAPWPAHPGRRS